MSRLPGGGVIVVPILSTLIIVGSVADRRIVNDACIPFAQTVGNFEHQSIVANGEVVLTSGNAWCPCTRLDTNKTDGRNPRQRMSITAHHKYYTVRPIRQYSSTADSIAIKREPLWT